MDLHLLEGQPHRRYNPLLREWVLVPILEPPRSAPLRRSKAGAAARPIYDPQCNLCPGNARADGASVPQYDAAFVLQDDRPALVPDPRDVHIDESGLILTRSEAGICRTVCHSPRHDLEFSTMEISDLRRLVRLWAEQVAELGGLPGMRYVQIFGDGGEAGNCGSSHPHTHVWASASVPAVPSREHAALTGYFDARHTCLLCDYLALEQVYRERFVCENQQFTALVPFWAASPFEVLLLSRNHLGGFEQVSADQLDALADVLSSLALRYDKLFDGPVPLSMGFHQQPTDGAAHPESHLHAHFYPHPEIAEEHRLPGGYPWLGAPLSRITPEFAASRLRMMPAPDGSAAAD